MNGRYSLDTNAVIALLSGNTALVNQLAEASFIAISVVVELEFLAFSGLSDSDRILFKQFKDRITVLSLDAQDESLLGSTINIRQRFNVKLPDAIIAASAIQKEAILISNDQVFQRIEGLKLQSF
jgi:predicted nucleic acid-binding protein